MMLKRIVMQVSGQVMAQFTAVYLRLMTCLLRLAKRLRAFIIQISQSVLIPLSPLARTLLSFKAWAANPTTQALSIKLALKRAVTISGQIGSRLLTIARQTRQRVNLLRKKGK